MKKIQTKEEVLIEALPYIQTYEGKTFVIKYGGAAMRDENLQESFAKDVTILRKIGINIIIVHGGGKDITDLASALNIPTRFVDGQRYTDEKMVEVVLMVLAGKLNKEIVNLINTNGGNALGICGIDNGLLKAKKITERDLGLVGDVSYVNIGFLNLLLNNGLVGEVNFVNVSFLNLLLNNGMMPVVAPLAVGDDNTILNINADLAAGAIAAELKAEKLVYLSDIEGVLVDKQLISSLTHAEAESLIERGAIHSGMIPKVRSAFTTLDAGVHKVHIIDGRIKHSLLLEIFTDEGVGTQMIHPS